MRRGVAAFVAVALLLVGLVEAPGALAKVLPCKAGTVKVKVGKRAACVKKQFVLPAPVDAAPARTELDAALTMTEAGLTGRAGKHAAPLTKRVGRSWTTVRSRVLKAMSAFFTKLSGAPQQSASAAGAQPNDVCLLSDLISRGSSFENETRKNIGNGATFNSNGVGVSLDITSDGGMQIGMQTNANGNTYTFKYESSESDCLKYALPPCPQADGSLDAYGRKGKVGFSTTVERAARS
jgi:hypothetical protein